MELSASASFPYAGKISHSTFAVHLGLLVDAAKCSESDCVRQAVLHAMGLHAHTVPSLAAQMLGDLSPCGWEGAGILISNSDPVALNKVFQLKVNGVAFRLIPDKSQVKNPLLVRDKSGSIAGSFPGVPVFQIVSIAFSSLTVEFEVVGSNSLSTKVGVRLLVYSLPQHPTKWDLNWVGPNSLK
ncbi:hypothetical protein PIB30_020238 [Stylosanthes scabra]|uniref:Uncharacterized protein n=1 Tax=Stylosanthes scabra TaxID=79078 RepID=A0ABU6TA68_9FABA|nr:hypothetical protein [Stylosanthes scabra]